MATSRARRRSIRLELLALGLAALAGCSKVNPYRFVTRPSGRQINVLIWKGYFSPDILAKFERDYGIRVNTVPFSSNADLYDVLKGRDPARPGPFDLAMPSSFMAQRLLEERLLAPFARKKIDDTFINLTNLNPPEIVSEAGEVARPDNLDKSYNLAVDPNNDYVVPYIWGVTGIGYNSERVASLPKSWSSFFVKNPRVHRHLVLIDDARFTLGSALIYIIAQRYSGSTLSSQEVAQSIARDFDNAGLADIRKAGDLVKSLGDEVICVTSDHVPELLASGEADMAIAWSGDVAVAMLRGRVDPPADEPPPIAPNLNIRVSLPTEGVILFRDCFVVPIGRRNQEAAEKFLNYLLDPAIAGEVSNYCCYATTVKSAAAIVLPQITDSAAFFIHPYQAKNLRLEDDDARATDANYAAVWAEVRSSFPPGVFKYPPEIPEDSAAAPGRISVP